VLSAGVVVRHCAELCVAASSTGREIVVRHCAELCVAASSAGREI